MGSEGSPEEVPMCLQDDQEPVQAYRCHPQEPGSRRLSTLPLGGSRADPFPYEPAETMLSAQRAGEGILICKAALQGVCDLPNTLLSSGNRPELPHHGWVWDRFGRSPWGNRHGTMSI